MGFHYVSVAGLALIAAAWWLQYRKMSQGRLEVTREFAIFQAAGVALLVMDGFLGGAYDLAAMNLVTCGGALLVLSKAKG
ncbi:MAG: hypothetical protein WCY41_04335 [Candidatus Micrarchaeia archaeon]